MTPDLRSIMPGRNARSRRTDASKLMLSAFCQSSSERLYIRRSEHRIPQHCSLVVCILNSCTDYSFLFPAAGQGGSGLDLLHLDPRPLDFRHDALDGGRPDEGLRTYVPASQEFPDRRFYIRHTYAVCA